MMGRSPFRNISKIAPSDDHEVSILSAHRLSGTNLENYTGKANEIRKMHSQSFVNQQSATQVAPEQQGRPPAIGTGNRGTGRIG